MADDAREPRAPKPMGWLLGLAVLMITFGVILGLVGIATVARRKQRFRIDDSPPAATNPAPSRPAR